MTKYLLTILASALTFQSQGMQKSVAVEGERVIYAAETCEQLSSGFTHGVRGCAFIYNMRGYIQRCGDEPGRAREIRVTYHTWLGDFFGTLNSPTGKYRQSGQEIFETVTLSSADAEYYYNQLKKHQAVLAPVYKTKRQERSENEHSCLLM